MGPSVRQAARQFGVGASTAIGWARRLCDNGERAARRVLAPTLTPGDVVVIDNPSSHKSDEVRQAIEAVGASVRLLPPCSPDFNLIEKAFAKLKALLRRAAARTVEALHKAVKDLVEAFTTTECANHFAACACDQD
jgi:transposase